MRTNTMKTAALYALTAAGLLACGDAGPGEETHDEGDHCTDGVVTVALPEEAVEPGGAVASRVVGMEGVSCADLAQPLTAINWYVEPTDPDDARSLAQYNAAMVPNILESGTQTLFTGGGSSGPSATEMQIDAEAPLQQGDFLAALVYASAESFAGMVTSDGYREVAPLKFDVEFDSYSFVFQSCVIGCDDLPAAPVPAIKPPAVAIHLSVDDDPEGLGLADREMLHAALLAADGDFAAAGYSVDYAGVAVAYPEAPREDGTDAFEYEVDGIDATLIITPLEGSHLGEVTETDAFIELQGAARAVTVAQIGG